MKTIVDIKLGDCREVLKTLADNSIDCCVTSPPYFGLRDYGIDGQIGQEQSPEEYIQEMVEVFGEVKRTLKEDGTCWINIGDSYYNYRPGKGQRQGKQSIAGQKFSEVETCPKRGNKLEGLKEKDLIGIPWMLAFALRADGWYLRQDIIWAKPNPMPESVKDRCTKNHEYIFLLTKSPHYFYDNEAIKEDAIWKNDKRKNKGRLTYDGKRQGEEGQGQEAFVTIADTKNKRSVWTVTTKAFKGAHFATYPIELIEPCILAGTSEKGHCPKCGARWERQVESKRYARDELDKNDPRYRPHTYNGAYEDINGKADAGYTDTKTTGWSAGCECGLTPIPDVVLDPFFGAGTTGYVARRFERSCIGIELNPEYAKIAQKRIDEDTFGRLRDFYEEA
jgi:DNA modification methylase